MKRNWKKHVGRRALRRECRLLALLVALAALLSACQPTPAEEAVVNRGDGTLEERISAPARAPGGYDCPGYGPDEGIWISCSTRMWKRAGATSTPC